MKRIFCLLLAFMLCFMIFGCDSTKSESGTVSPEEFDYVYGKIVEKIEPNILVLKPDTVKMADAFGDAVHIVTDEFDKWNVGKAIEVKIAEIELPLDDTQCIRVKPEKIDVYAQDYRPRTMGR